MVTASPSDLLVAAARQLHKHRVGCVVIAEKGKPVGALTDRDVALSVFARGVDLTRTRVADVMQQPLVAVESTSSLLKATEQMAHRAVRRLPVVDENGDLCGLLSADDVITLISEELFVVKGALAKQRPTLAPARSSRSLTGHFRKDVVAVPAEATLESVARAMDERGVGSVLVTDDESRAVGIITDRDLSGWAVTAAGRSERGASAFELMSHPVVSVAPEVPLEHVVGLMRERGIRRIPVLDDGVAVGIVSLDDVLAALARELSNVVTSARHGIAKANRLRRLQRARSHLHAEVDRAMERAAELGERAQEHLVRDIDDMCRQLSRRVG